MPTMRGQQPPIFDCEHLFLGQLELYEVENSTPLLGPEPTTPQLFVACSNRWETVMRHF